MQDFRNLVVWQRAHQLTLKVYRSSKEFPKDELYGIVSQMRRSAASMGANIAEGCCRKGDAEMSRFLQIAMGSASELEYHFLLAKDLGYMPPGVYDQLGSDVVEVKRMLASLVKKLKADS
jgi:four helix bundle protein